MAGLGKMSMAELNVRLWLGGELLRWIRTDPAGKNDLRAPAAIARLEKQVRALNDEQARRQRLQREQDGIPEPESVQVGLKALYLTARRH